MLLSRKLDPAIGSINRQPESLVKEIADWIQHTWEYSGEIKDKYVKEVIARGVSLRQSEIWRKMRRGEPKPDDVSDRSWRSLTLELESPTMIRKQESCSRANACRENFGRTGPSGEIGVRTRLKKQWGRSPDPDEVRFEMARDKGYSGRSKRSRPSENVMHGTKGALLTGDDGRISSRYTEEESESPSQDCSPPTASDVPVKSVVKGNPNVESVTDEGVLSISEEQLAQHPMVIRMMQRLEALEKRNSQNIVRGERAEHDNISEAPADDIPEQLPMEEEVGEQAVTVKRRKAKKVSVHGLWDCGVGFFCCNVPYFEYSATTW